MQTPILLFFVVLIGYACTSSLSKDPTLKFVPVPFIVNENTIQLVGTLDVSSNGEAIAQLQKIPNDSPVNIFIQSRGGPDIAFIAEAVRIIKQKSAVCFAREATSSAFTVFQACKVRLINNTSILAPSRIRASLVNMDSSAILAAYNKLLKIEEELTGTEAKAMDMKLEDYVRLVNKGLLLSRATDILDAKAADGLGVLSCDSTERQFLKLYRLPTANGKQAEFPIIMSECPLPRIIFDPILNENGLDFIGVRADKVKRPPPVVEESDPV